MIAKATFRVPVRLLDKLRELSKQEGRSLNDMAVLTFERGLGEAPSEEKWQVLIPLLEEIPEGRIDLSEIEKLWEKIGGAGYGLEKDLDWVRGEP
jgi:hypothetical protein